MFYFGTFITDTKIRHQLEVDDANLHAPQTMNILVFAAGTAIDVQESEAIINIRWTDYVRIIRNAVLLLSICWCRGYKEADG